jgi:DNA-binding transcriptional regulator YbjK
MAWAASGLPASPTAPGTSGTSRAGLVADTALALLAERGMRGLAHRAVDEAAGLPPGSTSNVARTRQALLELAVRRHAEREARLLPLEEMPEPGGGLDALADGLAAAVHRTLTHHRELLTARYELALEATRRPGLRAFYDRTGAVFKEQLTALLTAAGSRDRARHVLSLVGRQRGAPGGAGTGRRALETARPGTRSSVGSGARGAVGPVGGA